MEGNRRKTRTNLAIATCEVGCRGGCFGRVRWRGRRVRWGSSIRWAGALYLCCSGPGPGPGSHNATAPGNGAGPGRMIGYFNDAAQIHFHLQLPGKGIECDAISNNSDAEEGIRTNSVEYKENCFLYFVLRRSTIHRGSIHAGLSTVILISFKAASASFCLSSSFLYLLILLSS